MTRRKILPAVALVALAALGMPSCLSPTLPLPPPDAPSTISAGTTPDTWEVFGDCTAGAIVTVFNENTGKGVVVEDRAQAGVYHVTIEGTQCDLAWVREQRSDGDTPPTTFVLAPHMPGDPTDNPLCH